MITDKGLVLSYNKMRRYQYIFIFQKSKVKLGVLFYTVRL